MRHLAVGSGWKRNLDGAASSQRRDFNEVNRSGKSLTLDVILRHARRIPDLPAKNGQRDYLIPRARICCRPRARRRTASPKPVHDPWLYYRSRFRWPVSIKPAYEQTIRCEFEVSSVAGAPLAGVKPASRMPILPHACIAGSFFCQHQYTAGDQSARTGADRHCRAQYHG